MCPTTAAVVVTHNSESVIGISLSSLLDQSKKFEQIIIVDSGSDDLAYLHQISENPQVSVVYESNVGFSRSNNIGISHVAKGTDYVFFVNPDVILHTHFLSTFYEIAENYQDVGMFTGKLLGYDFTLQTATGLIDTTGIHRKWFGRWYDRGQGEVDSGQYASPEFVPAICGALMCCRKTVLDKFEGEVFNENFFMYKEDIELSLRVKKKGFSILYHPKLLGYHGRGWQQDRKQMPFKLREMSAKNEVLMYTTHPSIYIIWAVLKYILVKYIKA